MGRTTYFCGVICKPRFSICSSKDFPMSSGFFLRLNCFMGLPDTSCFNAPAPFPTTFPSFPGLLSSVAGGWYHFPDFWRRPPLAALPFSSSGKLTDWLSASSLSSKSYDADGWCNSVAESCNRWKQLSYEPCHQKPACSATEISQNLKKVTSINPNALILSADGWNGFNGTQRISLIIYLKIRYLFILFISKKNMLWVLTDGMPERIFWKKLILKKTEDRKSWFTQNAEFIEKINL